MAPSGSVSQWLPGVKAGDDRAAEQLWRRYFDKLIALAQKKLERTPCRAADGEDVALDAFAAFCGAARQGRFPRLSDRQDLWRILLKITNDKAVDQIRRESAQVRGGGRVRSESELDGMAELDEIIGNEPTPQFAAMVAENCRRLVDSLDDPALRAVAMAKLESYTNQEIALQQDCALRSVERRLQLIRKKWLLAVKA